MYFFFPLLLSGNFSFFLFLLWQCSCCTKINFVIFNQHNLPTNNLFSYYPRPRQSHSHASCPALFLFFLSFLLCIIQTLVMIMHERIRLKESKLNWFDLSAANLSGIFYLLMLRVMVKKIIFWRVDPEMKLSQSIIVWVIRDVYGSFEVKTDTKISLIKLLIYQTEKHNNA